MCATLAYSFRTLHNNKKMTSASKLHGKENGFSLLSHCNLSLNVIHILRFTNMSENICVLPSLNYYRRNMLNNFNKGSSKITKKSSKNSKILNLEEHSIPKCQRITSNWRNRWVGLYLKRSLWRYAITTCIHFQHKENDAWRYCRWVGVWKMESEYSIGYGWLPYCLVYLIRRSRGRLSGPFELLKWLHNFLKVLHKQ